MADPGTSITDKKIAKLEKKIKEIYGQAEKEIEDKITDFHERFKVKNDIYLQQLADGKITEKQYNSWYSGQMFQSKQWDAKREQILNVLNDANNQAAKIVNGERVSVFTKNYNWIHYDIEHTAGVNFGFNIYDQHTVTNLVAKNPNILPKWKIDEPKEYIWNKQKVNNCVTQGIIQGEGIQDVARRIATVTCNQNKNLALTHARTAMTGAQNSGRNLGLQDAKKKGIKVVEEWMATLDGHTRDSHRRMDGERLDPGDLRHPAKFSNGCRYPGDPQGPAHEVFNCRCTLVGDLVDYPEEYERRDNVSGETIRSMSYKQWESIREAEKKTGITTRLPTPSKFKKDFDTAKITISKNAWRVDDTYTVEDYEHKKLFELAGGSTVAVTGEGDIVSVCKNATGGDRGSDLLKVAVANGGDRLDAFGGDLYHFYIKNGFEPVSWTPFNEEYAPHDWVKGKDNPEPVIFYKYTGKTTDMSYSDFLSSVAPCEGENGYGDAMVIRNKSIGNGK